MSLVSEKRSGIFLFSLSGDCCGADGSKVWWVFENSQS